MQNIKEKAANAAASAKSGLEKTMATVEEKVEKARGHDPMQKEMATQNKEERIQQAELDKQEARQHNAAAKQAGTDGGFTATGTGAYTASGNHTYSTTGEHGKPTGARQMSALPGHGTGQPAGQVADGRAEAILLGKILVWVEPHPIILEWREIPMDMGQEGLTAKMFFFFLVLFSLNK